MQTKALYNLITKLSNYIIIIESLVFGYSYKRKYEGWGKRTEAYAITPKTARRLINHFYNKMANTDGDINEFVRRSEIKSYELVPPLFNQNEQIDNDIKEW